MRKCLAILFLTVFSLQVLPLRAIGKLLNPGQNMEEVQDGCEENGKVSKYGEDQVFPLHSFDLLASRRDFNNKVSLIIHKTETLPTTHLAARPSQPPDLDDVSADL